MPNVDVVFVSPLKRALQTAYYCFKDHPKFKDIQFIILPDLKEHLSCTCDIPGPIEPLILEFSKLFPKFDSSLLQEFENNKNLWFLSTLADEDKQRILRNIKENPETTYE